MTIEIQSGDIVTDDPDDIAPPVIPDISLSAVNEKLDAIMLVQAQQAEIIGQVRNNLSWVVDTVSAAVSGLANMPGIGGMMGKVLGNG